MASAADASTGSLKGMRNPSQPSDNRASSSSVPARFQMDTGSTDELEGDLSSLMDDDEQQLAQAPAGASSNHMMVPLGGPTAYGPVALHALHQQFTVDARQISVYQSGMSESTANELAVARARHVEAEATAIVANTTAAAERHVSLARAEAANVAVHYQKAVSSAESEKAAVAARAEAALATARSEAASTAALAEQHAAQVQSAASDTIAQAQAKAAQSVAGATAEAENRANQRAQEVMSRQHEHFKQEIQQMQAQYQQAQAQQHHTASQG